MNSHMPSRLEPADQRRRWLRILSILDACRWVGLTPITTGSLHVIVYLSEVLAPAWRLEPLDGKVLKQATAPYYPILQQDVDRLIGMGLVRVVDLQITRTDDGSPVLLPRIMLMEEFARPILNSLRELPDEEVALDFIEEVVQAFSRLSDEQVPSSMGEDATYGSPAVDTGQVIDLGEWKSSEDTATSCTVDEIRKLTGNEINPAEIIDIYVDHLVYRVNHERC